MKVGFIGCGQMATALVKGIANTQDSDLHIFGADPNADALENWSAELKSMNKLFQVCPTNQAVLDNCQYVFVAVKPQVIDEVAKELESNPANIFVSVVAGASIAKLQDILNSQLVVRAMPNTPCLIGKGATAIAAADAITNKDLELVTNLFCNVGEVVNVPEKSMDAITGLSGSGPAYVFTFIESLVDAGVLAGLPREIARTMTLQTILGATELVAQSEESPAVLRDRVTSPGGTTIHGMQQLEQNGFRSSILAAVSAATQRSKELGE